MIDANGYRANVGIMIANDQGQLFWARRTGRRGWQFPQGGMRADESPRDAMYRELHEETGLTEEDVVLLSETREWHTYHLPKAYQREDRTPRCIGQKQRWFLLRLKHGNVEFRLDHSDTPEFDQWRWIDYWQAAEDVVFFKRAVYRKVLQEFESVLLAEAVR